MATNQLPKRGIAMLTSSIVAHLTTLAGPDFTYPGVVGCGRPAAKDPRGGSPRRGLRTWLWTYQEGICPECDNARGPLNLDTAETAHVVSRGALVRGFMPANLMVLHSSCNTDQKDRGPVVDPSTLARPDLVALEWPVDKASGFYAWDPQR